MDSAPEPASPIPLPECSVFETTSPALAAALIAADRLAYSHCKLHRNAKDIIYVFDDPLQNGAELQRRYNAGAFPTVHAKMMTEARSYLADEGKRVKGGGHVNPK